MKENAFNYSAERRSVTSPTNSSSAQQMTLVTSIENPDRLKLDWRRVAACIWICLGAAVIAGSLAPNSAPPQIFSHFDKLVHMSAWALLSAFGPVFVRGGWNRAYAMCGLFSVSAAVELAQSVIPHRSASLEDLMANALGIVAGTGGGILYALLVARSKALMPEMVHAEDEPSSRA